MVLEKIKSGEEIASLHTHQEGVPGPFAGGEEIPFGFLTGRQVKREIDFFGAFPSSRANNVPGLTIQG